MRAFLQAVSSASRVYIASFRLAVALVFCGGALILAYQWLSLVPHPPYLIVSDMFEGVDQSHAPRFYRTGTFILVILGLYTLLIARAMKPYMLVQVMPDRVRQALDALTEGLLVLDERGNIVLANHSFTQTVGLSAEALVGRNAAALPWVTDEPALADDFPWSRARDANRPQSNQMMRYRVSDHIQRIFSINSAPILSSAGGNRGTLVTLRDVTQLEGNRSELEAMLAMIKENRDEISQKNRELEVLATQDALTGCYNRRAFFERFEQAFLAARTNRSPLACLMVDNDHFKSVNDTYGHHIGDEVLRRVGEILTRLHGPPLAACRFGGEEFCILLPGYNLGQARGAAEAIRREVAEICLPGLPSLRLSVSIGVADLTFGATEPQALINQADACLYAAKRAGRNCIVVYDPAVNRTPRQGSKTRKRLNLTPMSSPPAEVISARSPAVKSLISALAFRDADTAQHSRRVADHCLRMAAGLLNANQQAILEVAALLHDIGKIGVPDHILLKPESLTEDEWKLMALHDQIGVEIVENLFDSPELLAIIRFHHCFFGGQSRTASCPVGEAIPLAARLLAIADSYDAMVADRVYRKGRSHEAAIEELRRCCNTQFDPALVERFVQTYQPREQTGNAAIYTAHVQTVDFSKQIDRLEAAIASRDSSSVKELTGRVRTIARAQNLTPIVRLADRLATRAVGETEGLREVLQDSHELLRLCRDAQSSLVNQC